MANNRTITGDIADIPAAKKNPSAPLVRAIEPVTGGWSQDNNWGTSKRFDQGYPMTAQTIGLLQQTRLPGPPRCRSIYLDRTSVIQNLSIGSGVGAGSNFTIYARVRIGVGGSIVEFLVDWSSCVLNVIASSIQVDIVFAALQTDIAYSNAVRIGGTALAPVLAPAFGGTLSAHIGSDPSPFAGMNTYTQFFDNLANGLDRDVSVPQQAVSFGFTNTGVTPTSLGANAYVRFTNEPGLNGVTGPFGAYLGGVILIDTLTANGYLNQFALPGACKCVQFHNTSGVDIPDGFITWYLGI